MNNGKCPNCGYCPCCGRSDQQVRPYPWRPGPIWISPQPNTIPHYPLNGTRITC